MWRLLIGCVSICAAQNVQTQLATLITDCKNTAPTACTDCQTAADNCPTWFPLCGLSSAIQTDCSSLLTACLNAPLGVGSSACTVPRNILADAMNLLTTSSTTTTTSSSTTTTTTLSSLKTRITNAMDSCFNSGFPLPQSCVACGTTPISCSGWVIHCGLSSGIETQCSETIRLCFQALVLNLPGQCETSIDSLVTSINSFVLTTTTTTTTAAPQSDSSGAFCFSADDRVATLELGTISMEELFHQFIKYNEKGDVINVRSANAAVYSPLISWLHVEPELETEFLEITTKAGAGLKITGSHVIYFSRRCGGEVESILAENVTPQDCLMVVENGSLSMSPISNISTKLSKGIYAPLTEDGTIIVNDIAASCYVKNNDIHINNLVYNGFMKTLALWKPNTASFQIPESLKSLDALHEHALHCS